MSHLSVTRRKSEVVPPKSMIIKRFEWVSQLAQVFFKNIFLKNLFAMKSVLDVEVSCFRSYADTKPKPVNLLTWLTSDKYAAQVRSLRMLNDKADRDQIKASLPAITVSGTFHPSRKEGYLLKHSGLICIDIDLKGNEHITNFRMLKEQLFHIENVAYAGLSASGKGFFLIIPIAYPERHKQQFASIHKDFSDLGIDIDTAPKNVASLRGYSWDPSAHLRHQARPYRKWANPEADEKKEVTPLEHLPVLSRVSTKTRVERLVQQIVEHRIDITHEEQDWFRLACAFANEFKEGGREYFHAISQFYSEYDQREADRKFDHCLRGNYNQIGIGTFFSLVQQNAPIRFQNYSSLAKR
ncbi:MAG: hypothetical protein F6K19_34180 [Cyanothece sp. SIO1E1]|nr:hypothetical protein [Cyanothece sp. SIO1E1]